MGEELNAGQVCMMADGVQLPNGGPLQSDSNASDLSVASRMIMQRDLLNKLLQQQNILNQEIQKTAKVSLNNFSALPFVADRQPFHASMASASPSPSITHYQCS